MPERVRQRLEELGRRDGHLVVLGADVSGREPRVRKLVGLAIVEAHGKCLNGLVRGARDERRQHARIDAARQKHAERHVAHQVTRDGCFEPRAQIAGRRRRATGSIVGRRRVAASIGAAGAGSPGDHVSTCPGSSLSHAPEERLVARDEPR